MNTFGFLYIFVIKNSLLSEGLDGPEGGYRGSEKTNFLTKEEFKELKKAVSYILEKGEDFDMDKFGEGGEFYEIKKRVWFILGLDYYALNDSVDILYTNSREGNPLGLYSAFFIGCKKIFGKCDNEHNHVINSNTFQRASEIVKQRLISDEKALVAKVRNTPNKKRSQFFRVLQRKKFITNDVFEAFLNFIPFEKVGENPPNWLKEMVTLLWNNRDTFGKQQIFLKEYQKSKIGLSGFSIEGLRKFPLYTEMRNHIYPKNTTGDEKS